MTLPGVNLGFVRCPGCGTPQEGDSYNSPGFSACPRCRSRLNISAFPALYSVEGARKARQAHAAQDAATCFYHPTRTAVVPCDTCGRYLCSLCEIDMGSETICPNCMDKAARSEQVVELVDSRTLYDSIALVLAAAPVLLWFVTIITAPISLYMTVRHWRTPLSILPRSRVRFVLAFLIAVVQIVLWSILLFAVFT